MKLHLLLWVAAVLLFSSPAAAGTIHNDDLDAFDATWMIRASSSAEAEQLDSAVVLRAAPGTSSNNVLGVPYLSTEKLSRIVFDHQLLRGSFELTAVKFGTVNGRFGRLGSVSLGTDPGRVVDLKAVDWAGAEEIRLRLVLDAGTELRLDRITVQASAAPEPSAALLLGMGFLVTSAHLRSRRVR